MEFLMKTCERVLIKEHLEEFYAEFQNLLNTEKEQDLSRMYQLVSKIPNGLNELRNLLEVHIANKGYSAIEALGATAQNVIFSKILKLK